MRERLPDTRASITHKAVIRGEGGRVKFFITVGLYSDGRPGEVFLTFDQAGSGLDGWADAWSTAVSMCLQHQETLKNLVDKFSRQKFDPQGMTENPEIPTASSVVDYVMRWMEREFSKGLTEERKEVIKMDNDAKTDAASKKADAKTDAASTKADAKTDAASTKADAKTTAASTKADAKRDA